jgi:hypothetical protein
MFRHLIFSSFIPSVMKENVKKTNPQLARVPQDMAFDTEIKK